MLDWGVSIITDLSVSLPQASTAESVMKVSGGINLNVDTCVLGPGQMPLPLFLHDAEQLMGPTTWLSSTAFVPTSPPLPQHQMALRKSLSGWVRS